MQIHNIKPIYNSNSKILILGSFPSVISRGEGFYYAHPQNRFWSLISRILGQSLPQDNESRVKLLLDNNIALWDVIGSCDIEGSADSNIKNVIPNDIQSLVKKAKIEKVLCNGMLSYKLYQKYILPTCNIHAVKLPSTSPANAQWSNERLYCEWKKELR